MSRKEIAERLERIEEALALLVRDSRPDGLSPREVAERMGLSPWSVYRAIKRGDLRASSPVGGRLWIEVGEYERWRRQPVRDRQAVRSRVSRVSRDGSGAGSLRSLRAIEGGKDERNR